MQLSYILVLLCLHGSLATDQEKRSIEETSSGFSPSFGTGIGPAISSGGAEGIGPDVPTRHTYSEYHNRVPIPVPQAVPYNVPRAVPYPVHVGVPVDRPRAVPVSVPHPVPVVVQRAFPVPVNRPFLVPYPQPVPVTVTQGVGIPVPYPVSVPQGVSGSIGGGFGGIGSGFGGIGSGLGGIGSGLGGIGSGGSSSYLGSFGGHYSGGHSISTSFGKGVLEPEHEHDDYH